MDSICADDTDIISTDGTAHRFRINYSKIKDMSIGQYVTSPTFKSGGYQWAISFYPKGSREADDGDYSSIYLKLLDDHKDLNVSFTLGIVEGDRIEQSVYLILKRFSHTFRNSESYWGHRRFIGRGGLELYGINGVFIVLCTINLKDNMTYELNPLEDVSKLLKTGEMTDVKFEVDGEIFQAHRLILGMISPVFKAELFGSMSETRMDCIKIEEMKSEVFNALLHFIYTYSLPDHADIDMIQHLLVAADRYAIEGLITRCEERLIENISLDTVLGFLICAEQHNFKKLKDGCLEMVTQQKNFNELALSVDYGVMIQEFPSLLADLRKRMIIHS